MIHVGVLAGLRFAFRASGTMELVWLRNSESGDADSTDRVVTRDDRDMYVRFVVGNR